MKCVLIFNVCAVPMHSKVSTGDFVRTTSTQIESIKTTSMEDVSTRVLEKIKNI